MEGRSPLDRGSPGKRAGFHLAFTWEKPALLPGLARLAESPGLTTFIFPRNPESDICLKNAGQDNLCRVYGALTC